MLYDLHRILNTAGHWSRERTKLSFLSFIMAARTIDLHRNWEKALEEIWRADFRRAAESLRDIGVLMINLSEIMKSDGAENLLSDRQYRFYSRCMSVAKPAQKMRKHSLCARARA
jgi:RNase P/RNase MRP subunit p30